MRREGGRVRQGRRTWHNFFWDRSSLCRPCGLGSVSLAAVQAGGLPATSVAIFASGSFGSRSLRLMSVTSPSRTAGASACRRLAKRMGRPHAAGRLGREGAGLPGRLRHRAEFAAHRERRERSACVRLRRDESATFKYRARDTGPVKPDGHGAGAWKTVTLPTPEFLRRFLQHVLPAGFHRVRYFGWWHPSAKRKWARILALLDWKEPARAEKRAPWAMTCPCCGKPMERVGSLPRGPWKPP